MFLGAISLGYPEARKRGVYLAIWLGFKSMGQILGAFQHFQRSISASTDSLPTFSLLQEDRSTLVLTSLPRVPDRSPALPTSCSSLSRLLRPSSPCFSLSLTRSSGPTEPRSLSERQSSDSGPRSRRSARSLLGRRSCSYFRWRFTRRSTAYVLPARFSFRRLV